MSEEKKENWEREAKTWAAQADDPSNYFTRRSVIITKMIVRHRTSGKTMDVGCGSGLLSYLLAEKSFEVYGTDLSENMVAESAYRVSKISKNSSDRFRACIDGEIPFEGYVFDVITAIDVLPYIEDWPRYIAKLSNLLAKDGLLVLTNTNRRGLFSLFSIVYQFLRLPLELRETGKWKSTLLNLVRTGYWSGGFVDYRRSKQCYKAKCLDAMVEGIGLEKIDEVGLYDHPKFLDKGALDRGALGQYLVRHLGWHHIAVYQRKAGGP